MSTPADDLRHPAADVRRRAVRRAAAADVLAALADPAWVVREAAADAAGRLPDPADDVRERLVAVAVFDPKPAVREAAAAAVGPRVEPERDYGASVGHPFERRRMRAAVALGFVAAGRAADAVGLLGPLLTDPHVKVRRAALSGLVRLPPAAVRPLIPAVVRRCFEADLTVALAADMLRQRLFADPAGEPLRVLEPAFVPDGWLQLLSAVVAAPPDHPAKSAYTAVEVRGFGHRYPKVLAAVCERVLSAPRGGLAPPSP